MYGLDANANIFDILPDNIFSILLCITDEIDVIFPEMILANSVALVTTALRAPLEPVIIFWLTL